MGESGREGTEMAEQADVFSGWSVLELMGHRRLGGYVSQHEFAGAAFIRIDVPGEGGEVAATQLYAPAAVYCLTPTTEANARAVALRNRPEPVQRWELPAPTTEAEREGCADCGRPIPLGRDLCEGCAGDYDDEPKGDDNRF